MSEKGWNSSLSALSDDTPDTPGHSCLVDKVSDEFCGMAARTSDPGSTSRRTLRTADGSTSMGCELPDFFSQHMPTAGPTLRPAICTEATRNASRVRRHVSMKASPFSRADGSTVLQPTPRASLNGVSGSPRQTVAGTPKRAVPPPLQLCSPWSTGTASILGPFSPQPPPQGRLPRVPTSNSLGICSDSLPAQPPPIAASPKQPIYASQGRCNLVGPGANQFLIDRRRPELASGTETSNAVVGPGPVSSSAGPAVGPSSGLCLPPLPTRWSGDGTSGWARPRAPCSSLFTDGPAEFGPTVRAARADTRSSNGGASQRGRHTSDGRGTLFPSLSQGEGIQASSSSAVLPLPDITTGVPSPRLACAWAASDSAACSPAPDPGPGRTRQLLAAVHGTDPATPMRPSAPVNKSRRWNSECGRAPQLMSPFGHISTAGEAAARRQDQVQGQEPVRGLGLRALRSSVTVPAPQRQAMAWQPKPPSPPSPPPPAEAPLPCKASPVGCRRTLLVLEAGSEAGDASPSGQEGPLALSVFLSGDGGDGGGVRRQPKSLNTQPSAAGIRTGSLVAVTEAEEEWLLPVRSGKITK